MTPSGVNVIVVNAVANVIVGEIVLVKQNVTAAKKAAPAVTVLPAGVNVLPTANADAKKVNLAPALTNANVDANVLLTANADAKKESLAPALTNANVDANVLLTANADATKLNATV